MSSPMSSDRAQLIERLRERKPEKVLRKAGVGVFAAHPAKVLIITVEERDALLAALGAEAEPPWQRDEALWLSECDFLAEIAVASLDGHAVVKQLLQRIAWIREMLREPSPPPSVRERENEK